MQALICREPGRLELVERPAPTPEPGEVVVRIRRVGICGTDFHIYAGQHPYLAYPRVMGHELAGEVADTNGTARLRIGQLVYINPYLACRACHACRRGRPNCCMHLRVLGVHTDGGMVEFLCVPEANVQPADGLSLDQAAMVEFLAVGAHAVRRSLATARDRVLVIGAGPIGLGVVAAATGQGCDTTVLDLREQRLAVCRDAFGITQTVLADNEAETRLSELTSGDLFDVVIDATGNAASIERGVAYVAHAGAYVLVSVVKGAISFADPEFHKREMTLLGSRNALADDFADVVAAIAAGRLPTARLSTHHGSLADLPEAMPRWMRPETGVVKALLEL
jgi:2-desacetyl-2-hydroxyethyl bacteriochlorophyllide A dehydrogenase